MLGIYLVLSRILKGLAGCRTNFQLIASTKSNLKRAEEQIAQGIVHATTTFNTLLLGLQSNLLLGLVVA